MGFLVNSFIEFPAPIVVDDTGLIAYYKFDESSGTLLNKSISGETLGTNANGAENGNPTYDVSGVIDTAISLDGTGDYFVLGTSQSQWNVLHNGLSDWTVCFWMKLNAVDPSAYQSMLSDGATSGTDIQVGIALDDTGARDHKLQVLITNGSGQRYLNTSDDFIPKNTSTWYFYTITYTASGDVFNVYRDTANNENNTSTFTNSTSNSSDPMSLGSVGDHSASDMNAIFDEMSIWSRLLSSDEIGELYNSGSGLAIY